MSDNGDDVDEYNTLDHQACYIFTPTTTSTPTATSTAKRRTAASQQRPNKRRRAVVSASPDPAASHDDTSSPLFIPLLNNTESKESIQTRWDTLNKVWSRIDDTITSILDELDLQTVQAVKEYVSSAKSVDGKVPTALIMAGSNIAAHARLFEHLREGVQEGVGGRVVLLNASEGGGLKGVLKRIVRDGTMGEEGSAGNDDDEELAVLGAGRRKMLNYDLRILAEWCRARKTMEKGEKIVVAIQDIEAFDANVFAELVSLLAAYLDRIPFVLLLGVATSLEIFHERIPKYTIRLMAGKRFDVERAGDCLERVFNATVIPGCGEGGIMLGPSVCEWITRRQREHAQSIQATVAAVRYAHMSHFFANCLSGLVAEDGAERVDELGKEILEAVRNTGGFRRLVHGVIEDGDVEGARRLIDDDGYLKDKIAETIQAWRTYGHQMSQGLEALEIARSCTTSQAKVPRYELYIKALTGELRDSPQVRELLLSIKKMSSDSLLKLLTRLSAGNLDPELVSSMSYCHESLEKILAMDPTSAPLRTATAQPSQIFSARSKKLEASGNTNDISEQQKSYITLMTTTHASLSNYFSKSLAAPPVFLREAFIYDTLSPLREVLAPAPRTSIENALAAPTNYLACPCCHPTPSASNPTPEDHEPPLSSTLPPTSILYKLYLESGALINIYDLWKAFSSVLCTPGEEGGGEMVEEEMAQALFYRAVAELRFLGLVKYSRGRKDCLVKVGWRGL